MVLKSWKLNLCMLFTPFLKSYSSSGWNPPLFWDVCFLELLKEAYLFFAQLPRPFQRNSIECAHILKIVSTHWDFVFESLPGEEPTPFLLPSPTIDQYPIPVQQIFRIVVCSFSTSLFSKMVIKLLGTRKNQNAGAR